MGLHQTTPGHNIAHFAMNYTVKAKSVGLIQPKLPQLQFVSLSGYSLCD